MYLLERVCSFWRFGQRNRQILDTYLVGFLGNQFIGGLLVDDVRLHVTKGISHLPGQTVLRMDFRQSRKHGVLGYRPVLALIR